MPVPTHAAVRELAGIRGEGTPITSCYLDVDGRRLVRQQDVEHELDRLLRDARRRHADQASVLEDLRRIEAHVRAGLERGSTRGLAVFANSAEGLWQVVELPFAVRSRVVVNHAPAVGLLEAALHEHAPIGVLLADRQSARLFVFAFGELVDRSELLDELPRDYDTRGDRERGTPAAHVDELAHQHLRHAARAAFDLWQANGFARLAIGAPDPLVGELEGHLHPYLRERLCGRLHVAVGASAAEVLTAAQALEHQARLDREDAVVARLREASLSGGRGVAGLGATLVALNERRVEHLVVSEGYAEEGWRCPTTGDLLERGPDHPVHGTPLERVPDVVEDAVDDALAQGLPVTLCAASADLDVLGRIGALLRY